MASDIKTPSSDAKPETAKAVSGAKPAAKAKPAPKAQSSGPSKPAGTSPAGAKSEAKTEPAQASKPRQPSSPRKITGDTFMSNAKKDATTETLDKMSQASNKAVKEGFEKSLNALNDFSAFQKETVDAVIASANTTSKSVEALNANSIAFAKKSMEDGVTAAKSMSSAKSIQELIEIQADYTKSSLDAYLSEVNKATELMSSMFKDGFKPLNDRVAAAVEVAQSQR